MVLESGHCFLKRIWKQEQNKGASRMGIGGFRFQALEIVLQTLEPVAQAS